MPRHPQIALIISTYQRPFHLQRALLSVACQRGVQGEMEVVVTDDGVEDEVSATVLAFAKTVSFPVRMTAHPHDGFRLARCRNEGVAASTAPYLLFTDGDCLLPEDHVEHHLRYRRRGTVVVGDCYRIDQFTSARITEPAIRSGEFVDWVSRNERARIARKAFRARISSFLRCRMHPRMTGCNIGVWRDDYQRVNGFDEQYVGWGLEDRDLQRRLGRLGLRFWSILQVTVVHHLWHPRDATFARNGEGTANLRYYQREVVPSRCHHGLANGRADTMVIDFSPEPAGHRYGHVARRAA
jgi:GT2 family glycosyltransferase